MVVVGYKSRKRPKKKRMYVNNELVTPNGRRTFTTRTISRVGRRGTR